MPITGIAPLRIILASVATYVCLRPGDILGKLCSDYRFVGIDTLQSLDSRHFKFAVTEAHEFDLTKWQHERAATIIQLPLGSSANPPSDNAAIEMCYGFAMLALVILDNQI